MTDDPIGQAIKRHLATTPHIASFAQLAHYQAELDRMRDGIDRFAGMSLTAFIETVGMEEALQERINRYLEMCRIIMEQITQDARQVEMLARREVMNYLETEVA